MSLTLSGQMSTAPVRRVRDQVREGIAVIVFSAAASSGLAAGLMLFLYLVGQGA